MLGPLLKAGFAFLALGLLIRVVGWRGLLEALQDTALPWLLAMYGVMMVGRIMESVQMQLILDKAGRRLQLARIFLASSLSALYALIVPGDVVAGAAKWANLSAAAGEKSVIFNAIVYNRLVILLPPLILGMGALIWDDPFPETPLTEVVAVMAITGFATVMCIFHPRYGAVTERILRIVSNPLPKAISRRVEMILSSLIDFRRFRLKDHLTIYSIGILNMFLGLVMFVLGSRAAGLKIPFLTLTWIMALLLTFRQIPLTPGSLGIREGILIAVLGPYGVAPERAFALGLIIFSGQIVMALVGLAYQIALTFGIAQWNTDNST